MASNDRKRRGKPSRFQRNTHCRLRNEKKWKTLTRKEFEYLVKLEKYEVLETFLSDQCPHLFEKQEKFSHREIVSICVSKAFGEKSGFERRMEEEEKYDEVISTEYNIHFNRIYICKELTLTILEFLSSAEASSSFGLTCKSAYLCVHQRWNDLVKITNTNIYEIPQIIIRNVKFSAIHSPLPKHNLTYLFSAMDKFRLRSLDFLQGKFDISKSSSRNGRFLTHLLKSKLVFPNVRYLRLTYGVREKEPKEEKIQKWKIETTFPNLRTIDIPFLINPKFLLTEWKNIEHFHHGMNERDLSEFLGMVESSTDPMKQTRCHEIKSIIRTTVRMLTTSYETRKCHPDTTDFPFPEFDRQISQDNFEKMIDLFPNLELINIRTPNDFDFEKLDNLPKLHTLNIGNINEEVMIKKPPNVLPNVRNLRMENIRFKTFFNVDGGIIQQLFLWSNLRTVYLHCASKQGNEDFFWFDDERRLSVLKMLGRKWIQRMLKMTWFPKSLIKFIVVPIQNICIKFRRNGYLKVFIRKEKGHSWDYQGRKFDYRDPERGRTPTVIGGYNAYSSSELEYKNLAICKWMFDPVILKQLQEYFIPDEPDDDENENGVFKRMEFFVEDNNSSRVGRLIIEELESQTEFINRQDDIVDHEDVNWIVFSLVK